MRERGIQDIIVEKQYLQARYSKYGRFGGSDYKIITHLISDSMSGFMFAGFEVFCPAEGQTIFIRVAINQIVVFAEVMNDTGESIACTS